MVVIMERNRSRRRYEQSEPTEPRPATGRPGQAGPTAGRRRPAEARPATAGARKGRSGRTAPGRTRAKPINDLRQFDPGFSRSFFCCELTADARRRSHRSKKSPILNTWDSGVASQIGPRPAPPTPTGDRNGSPGDITPLTSPMMFHEVDWRTRRGAPPQASTVHPWSRLYGHGAAG